jgi:hypothetical protein
MVKNGLNSLRNSTSNLSLRPTLSEIESNGAARQRMADLEARIAEMNVEYEERVRSCAAESSASSIYPSPEQLRALQTNIDARSRSGAAEASLAPVVYMRYPGVDGAYKVREMHTAPPRGESLGFLGRETGVQHSASPAHPQHSPATYPTPPPRSLPPRGASLDSIPAPFGSLSPWADRNLPTTEVEPEKSLFEKFNESLQEQHNKPKGSLITKGLVRAGNALKSPEAYTQPFCDFLTENPTVWHAVAYFEGKLEKAGFKKVGSLVLNRGRD